jgi:hypothetical protein
MSGISSRVVEARSIITHGLAENADRHEEYMTEFRRMVAQVERLYPLWLIDRSKSDSAADQGAESEDIWGKLEQQDDERAPDAPVVEVPQPESEKRLGRAKPKAIFKILRYLLKARLSPPSYSAKVDAEIAEPRQRAGRARGGAAGLISKSGVRRRFL